MDGRRLGVEPICQTLQVAPSTYYAARGRAPSARAQRDAEVILRLVKLWKANYEVYGSRKLWKAAKRSGVPIGCDQTRRLMRPPEPPSSPARFIPLCSATTDLAAPTRSSPAP
ncbi:hypothetical protein DSM104329_03618 [Capillimicrobium parvum]|uniref:HTH-like domain-containing protein n=1 Tax=Capillimicrobium parvum TaxID=2884022 RepID=A0A9E6XZU4_9ACTN|nr:hypothetical protein DSM104329_03618 [Capillimicrobium parvum]